MNRIEGVNVCESINDLDVNCEWWLGRRVCLVGGQNDICKKNITGEDGRLSAQ